MKVNYFGYFFHNLQTDDRRTFDVRRMLKNYCSSGSSHLKNQFPYQDEKLYLLHQVGDVFLFLQTRSQEIIRKVDTNTVSVDEIASMLGDDERLGFASYMLVKEDYIGFGSTLLAPRMDVFAYYMNKLLELLRVTDWTFMHKPILKQITKSEALSMDFIGASTMVLDKNNGIAQDFLAVLGANGDSTVDFDGFEITLKPKPRQNIKPLFEKVLNTIPDEGIRRMVIKARKEAASQLTDLYLVGQSVVYDNIDKSKESTIPRQLEDKHSSNIYLTQCLTEFRNGDFSQMVDNSIIRFNNADTWADSSHSL